MDFRENNTVAQSAASLFGVDLVCGRNTCLFTIDGTDLQCEIFLPDNYRVAGNYPVILFLHGDGLNGKSSTAAADSGEAAIMQRAMSEMHVPFIGIVPVANEPWIKAPDDEHVPRPRKNYNMSQTTRSAKLTAAEKLLDVALDTLKADKDRVYLTGYSRGTMASWYLLSKTPEKFAAAVLACGAGDPKVAPAFIEVPLKIYMGDEDSVVDYRSVMDIYKAYAAAGGKGTFVKCKGAGHNLTEFLRGDKDVITWLFEQKKQR